MAMKIMLTSQEDFTGEYPSAWAASGLWRFNESAPDSNTRLADSSLHGRDFTVVNLKQPKTYNTALYMRLYRETIGK